MKIEIFIGLGVGLGGRRCAAGREKAVCAHDGLAEFPEAARLHGFEPPSRKAVLGRGHVDVAHPAPRSAVLRPGEDARGRGGRRDRVLVRRNGENPN